MVSMWRLEESRSTNPEIPGVHQQSILHVLADSHKLTQNARALVRLLLCDDELHARGVHSVAQRRNNSKVGYAEERVELVLFQCLVAITQRASGEWPLPTKVTINALMVDGDKVQTPVLAVDMGDQLTHHPLQFWRVIKRR